MLFNCSACGSTYTRNSSLRRHYQSKHDDRPPLICRDCNLTFTQASNLQRHQKTKHIENHVKYGNNKFECEHCSKQYLRKDHLNCTFRENIFSRISTLICDFCGKEYVWKENLIYHIRKQHLFLEKKAVFLCPLCTNKSFESEDLMLHHFNKAHGIQIETLRLQFGSLAEFDEWKKKYERKTYSRYLRQNQSRYLYRCHRSGFYFPVKDRRRKASLKGSKKINAYCPSRMKLVRKVFTAGAFYLYCISTHVGHDTDFRELAHIQFDSSVREKVVSRFAAGVPVRKILRDFKSVDDSDTLSKEYFITRKDVRNITLATVRSNPGHVDEIFGVVGYVKSNLQSVLYFKNENELDERHAELNAEDFVLIIMKQQQYEKLKNLGGNVICMDGTHSTSTQEFILHSLLIVDDDEEEYPCCFLITNRSDQTPINTMLSLVKEKLGEVTPRVFLSDTRVEYINAWRRVMQCEPDLVLYNTFHVRKTWIHHLNRIKSIRIRYDIKNALHSMLNETDEKFFWNKFSSFIANPEKEAEDFFDYFKREYMGTWALWATCFRQSSGFSTNVSLDYFHRAIKYDFGKGLRVTSIPELLRFLEDYMLGKSVEEEGTVHVEDELDQRIRFLKKAHYSAASSIDRVYFATDATGDRYTLKSFSKNDRQYEIIRNYEKGCVQNCTLMCLDCGVCAHEWRCSCEEYEIRKNMCMHIHSLKYRRR